MELNEKMEALGKAFEEFKANNEQRLNEEQKRGEATAETLAKLEASNTDISKLQDEIKSVKTAMNRTNYAEGKELSAEECERKEAFAKFMRKGAESMSEIERKALTVDSDPDGGYLVRSELAQEMSKRIFDTSPVRQVASVQSISTAALDINYDLDEPAAEWVNEQAARPETATPTLRQIVIPTHELFAKPKASQKLLDDALVNVESWLSGKVAEKFARAEATAFVSGDGVGKPRGFLTYAASTADEGNFNAIQQQDTAAVATLDADDVIEVYYKLQAPFRPNATWMMNREIIKEVRKLKDADNQYLWQPGLQAGTPDLLLGRPVAEADDMPAAVATDNLIMAIGDFGMAYQIVDRIGIRVLRDPFSAKPFVEFYTTKRVGGAVKQFDAIKLLKVQ